MRLLVLALALMAVGCAETPKETASRLAAEDKARAGLDRELAGLTPGAPQTCINTFDRSQLKAFGETLVYSNGGRSVRYVTRTTGCQDVGGNNILVTRTPTTQLCRGDIAFTYDRTARIENGGCSYGDFIPYRRP